MPVWHASVAILGQRETILFEDLTPHQIKKAAQQAKRLLRGVGVGEMGRFHTIPPGHAVHVQRALSEAEIGQLPDGWMELPAIDEVGPRRFF